MAKPKLIVRPFKNPSGDTVYRLSGTVNGKRIRKNFHTEALATGEKHKLEIKSLRIKQQSAVAMVQTTLSEWEVRDAEAAVRELAPYSISDAVKHFKATYRPPETPTTAREALELFLKDKRRLNRRERTIGNLKSRVGLLIDAFPEKCVHEFTSVDLELCLIGEPQTQRNKLSAWSTFFKWCRNKKRGFCSDDPTADIETPEIDTGAPKIFTIQECIRLLEASRGTPLCNYIALSIFCGIRPAELERLKMKSVNIRRRSITLDETVAKVRDRRVIEISKNCVQWLDRKQPIYPKNFKRQFARLRKSARVKWDEDIMRHTCLTYYFERVKSEDKTAKFAGNSTKVLHQSYRGLVEDPDDVTAFWSLVPLPSEGKIVAFGKTP